MQKLLSEFLRNPSDLFLDQCRQRVVIVSSFSLLFLCILFSMASRAVRNNKAVVGPNTSPSMAAPGPSQTKWWVRDAPSETPTSLIPGFQNPIGTETPLASIKCPAYAADFKPGIFGYISLAPPFENLVRSGAGKNYSIVGYIEIGDWVRILAEPVCADDGSVWLNVQSTVGSRYWTAGGHKTAQWVIPCPDPNKKCSKKRVTESIPAKPAPNNQARNNNDGRNSNTCASDKLAVGLDAQISPDNLLVVRSEPFTGGVIGRIAPLTVINIIGGPKCVGGAVWWKVWGPQTGWAVENNLRACPKEGSCDPWKNEQLLR